MGILRNHVSQSLAVSDTMNPFHDLQTNQVAFGALDLPSPSRDLCPSDSRHDISCCVHARQLTKTVRALEKETARHVALKDETDKLRTWKANKAAEIEDLMEKVSSYYTVVSRWCMRRF